MEVVSDEAASREKRSLDSADEIDKSNKQLKKIESNKYEKQRIDNNDQVARMVGKWVLHVSLPSEFLLFLKYLIN
jgi:hypothetical protein